MRIIWHIDKFIHSRAGAKLIVLVFLVLILLNLAQLHDLMEKDANVDSHLRGYPSTLDKEAHWAQGKRDSVQHLGRGRGGIDKGKLDPSTTTMAENGSGIPKEEGLQGYSDYDDEYENHSDEEEEDYDEHDDEKDDDDNEEKERKEEEKGEGMKGEEEKKEKKGKEEQKVEEGEEKEKEKKKMKEEDKEEKEMEKKEMKKEEQKEKVEEKERPEEEKEGKEAEKKEEGKERMEKKDGNSNNEKEEVAQGKRIGKDPIVDHPNVDTQEDTRQREGNQEPNDRQQHHEEDHEHEEERKGKRNDEGNKPAPGKVKQEEEKQSQEHKREIQEQGEKKKRPEPQDRKQQQNGAKINKDSKNSRTTLRKDDFNFYDGFLKINETYKGVSVVKIILLAYQRSGSSFAGELLTSGNDSLYVYEPFFRWREQVGRQDPMRDMEGMARALGDVLDCRSEVLHEFEVRPFNYLRRISSQPEWCGSAPLRLVKTIRLRAFFGSSWLRKRPDVKVIHLVRDPRGIISSVKSGGGIWSPKNRDAEIQCLNIEDDLKLEALLGPRRYLRIRYEDLVDNTTQMTKKALEFAGVKLTEEVKAYIEKHTGLASQETKRKYMGTYRDDSFRYDQWKTKLEQNEIEHIQGVCSSVMKRLDYRPYVSAS